MTGFRKSHAIVIGIDDYCAGIPPLRTAINDARAISGVLKEKFGYVVNLLTEDVTLGKLKRLFEETLPAAVKADDRVLIYFAGHGVALDGDDGPQGYLIPQDARRDDRQSFLKMTELHEWLERLPCRHLVLILDCCFAGAFRWIGTRDLGFIPDVVYQERFDRYIRDPAWQVLTSAAYDQEARDVIAGVVIGRREDGLGAHSPFASAILKAMEGAADLIPRPTPDRPEGDGIITATELYLYLREEVEGGCEGYGHRQTPGLWPLRKHDKGEYIWLVPGHDGTGLPHAPDLSAQNNPYRGLESYSNTEEDSSLFFGRDELILRLSEHVRSHRLTIVIGVSGTGKSSVVRAGLLPHLSKDVDGPWQILPLLRPGKDPLKALAEMALPSTLSHEDGVHESGRDLAERVECWVKQAAAGRLVLVVDQAEELITHCRDAAVRHQFLGQLAAAMDAQPDRFRVVLTLRSDFEPDFITSPLRDDWMTSRIVVQPMSISDYRKVVERPAEARALYFKGKDNRGSQDFIDRIMFDVEGTPGALPLLSFTLNELYLRRARRGGPDRDLSEEDYEEMGGVGGSPLNMQEWPFFEVFCNLAPSSVVLGHGFSQKARVFDGFPC